MNHPSYLRLAAAVVLLAPLLAACGQSQPPAGGPPPAPAVTVAKPIERGVTEQDEYVGRFVAVDSVEIRARVSGYLDQIHFRDGQMVKQGDLLFTIDKRPFQNTVARPKERWRWPRPISLSPRLTSIAPSNSSPTAR